MNRSDSSVARLSFMGRLFTLLGALSSAAAFAAAPGTQGGPQYGYCSAQTPGPKQVYVSAVFEMALPDIQEHNRVMNAEFNKMLDQNYGNEARTHGCTVAWNVPKAKAEEMRQIIMTAAKQEHAELVDTGWTFVRTAQTPPPGPPVGGH
jgi:hypothetical protein